MFKLTVHIPSSRLFLPVIILYILYLAGSTSFSCLSFNKSCSFGGRLLNYSNSRSNKHINCLLFLGIYYLTYM
ncbi:hypothetical protein BDF19DRAFT_437454 [Syncephalis fuscata]|nr:hypothetical protein BDF19DRAFT_437454 [Syncephalis fuscata]